MRQMNTIMRAVTVAAMVGLLFGCATAAQRQYQAIATNNRSAAQTFQTCVVNLYNSPEVAPLRTNLPLDVNHATLAQLANRSFATDVEVRAILQNHPKLQTCRQAFLAQLSQTMPTFAPIFIANETRSDSNVIELIQRKVAWGEFLQRESARTIEATAQLLAEGRRIEAGLEQSHEAELERRRAAIQAAGNALERGAQVWQANINANRGLNCTTTTIPTVVSTQPRISSTNCY
jgi:hypothetical protein